MASAVSAFGRFLPFFRSDARRCLEDFRAAYGHWYRTGAVSSSYDEATVAAKIVLAKEKLAVLDVVEKELQGQIRRAEKTESRLSESDREKDHDL